MKVYYLNYSASWSKGTYPNSTIAQCVLLGLLRFSGEAPESNSTERLTLVSHLTGRHWLDITSLLWLRLAVQKRK